MNGLKRTDMKRNTKDKLYEKAGERIEKLRCTHGYSRKMLADKAGVSEKFIYEIETGKKGFSTEVLYHISDVLGASCDYILLGRRKRGKANQELMAMVERFDETDSQKMLDLIKILYEFKK